MSVLNAQASAAKFLMPLLLAAGVQERAQVSARGMLMRMHAMPLSCCLSNQTSSRFINFSLLFPAA